MSSQGFIDYLLESQYMTGAYIDLIDVGASGGIHQRWSMLGNKARGVGFDPHVAEVERLNSISSEDEVTYKDAWITSNEPTPPEHQSGPMDQSTAFWATDLMAMDYAKEQYNHGAERVLSNNRLTLDEYLASDSLEPNFLKTDTDGYDYFVLKGAERLLDSKGLLGIEVECNFHGEPDSRSNTFSNIDFLLRTHGFSLFELNPWCYTKRDLPGEFFYQLPAQTVNGQVQWADAVYFRDPTFNLEAADYFYAKENIQQCLKLLLLLVLYRQEDTAACIINNMIETQLWPKDLDHKRLLNDLVPSNKWGITEYDRFIAKFRQNPENFYPPPPKSTDTRTIFEKAVAKLGRAVSSLKGA